MIYLINQNEQRIILICVEKEMEKSKTFFMAWDIAQLLQALHM